MPATNGNPPTLYVVVPCYNEEAVLPITSGLLKARLEGMLQSGKIGPSSRILFVNDGSDDATWDIIERLAAGDPVFEGIGLSRNRGHQNALLAGLMECRDRCDITISIDADGQDDPAAMEDMVDAYARGCDVVYGVRNDRSSDSTFKRDSAHGFYRLMSLMGVETVYDHADYRLLSERVVRELANFGEVNLFLRGMVPLVGFASTSVYYERRERAAGSSHYPLSKMLALAIDGITSLSITPIRIVAAFGFLASAVGLAGIIWAIAASIMGITVSGWASTIVVISFFGGIQTLSLGVVGEYVGKTYLEAKHRPRFIVAKRTGERGRAHEAESPQKTEDLR
jgi:glycosyltransferase involved in cell wall biosynthesis